MSSHIPMFSFVYNLSIPMCPPHGSADQSTNTVLVAWPAHNFLIASPASPHKYFCFCFPQAIVFSTVHSCFSFIIPLYVSFFCHLSFPVCSHKLRRAIHLYQRYIPFLPSTTLSPSKTPVTSFSLTNNTTLQF